MKLTNKCKEDFINFMCKKHPDVRWHEYETMPICYLNALIIEFFDSVGVYIFPVQFESKIYCNLRNIYGTLLSQTNRLNTRQEATSQAIITANKLYNETD